MKIVYLRITGVKALLLKADHELLPRLSPWMHLS